MAVKLPPLHPSQQIIAAHPARFKVLACGRRWGKTRLGVWICIKAALEGKRAWWVAPTYSVANIGWREIKRLAQQIPGAIIREGDRIILFPTGGEVSVRSADNPDTLRGEGLDLVVMDECAFIVEEAFTEALRPALSDRLGQALLISTPKGRNWFWRAWMRGQDPLQSEWQSWKKPTVDNPYILASEVLAASTSIPQLTFQQEYLAEFVEDAGAVFRKVMDAAKAKVQDKPQYGHVYTIGADLAKVDDFTVFSVIDATIREQCYLDRFNEVDYTLQLSRLVALNSVYKPAQILIEKNSNEMFVEMAQRAGLPVMPFTTTNSSKTQIIDGLALAFEQQTIKILNEPVQIGELQAFEMERLGRSGLMRYSAPPGLHDDTVMALAIGWSDVAESFAAPAFAVRYI